MIHGKAMGQEKKFKESRIHDQMFASEMVKVHINDPPKIKTLSPFSTSRH